MRRAVVLCSLLAPARGTSLSPLVNVAPQSFDLAHGSADLGRTPKNAAPPTIGVTRRARLDIPFKVPAGTGATADVDAFSTESARGFFPAGDILVTAVKFSAVEADGAAVPWFMEARPEDALSFHHGALYQGVRVPRGKPPVLA